MKETGEEHVVGRGGFHLYTRLENVPAAGQKSQDASRQLNLRAAYSGILVKVKLKTVSKLKRSSPLIRCEIKNNWLEMSNLSRANICESYHQTS